MGLKILIRLIFMVILLGYLKGSPLKQKETHNVAPKSYALNIQIFPDEEKFGGDIAINIIWLESTNLIPLNAHKNLNIEATEVVLMKPGSTGLKEENIKIKKSEQLDNEKHNFNILLEKSIPSGSEGRVKVKFSGKLNTDPEGLFKEKYVDETTGHENFIITSKFRPNFTSSAFPCFDDPSFKVPFDVSIQRPSKLHSTSTMPLLQSVDVGTGWTKDVFTTTPPIATFSLAIFVTDLPSMIYNKPDLQIRIWSTPQLLQKIKEKRSDAIYNVLNRYEGILGTKYPLTKLDYVAFPKPTTISNIGSCLGLIISRDCKLEPSSVLEETGVSYEVIDQWIGNLLTPSSAEEEIYASSLAVFISSFYIVKAAKKENQNSWHSWPISNLYSTYYELGTPMPREDPEIRRMVMTSKNEMIYNMLSYIITEQTFTKALKNFIRDKRFNTFEMDNFWDALTVQAHTDRNLPSDLTIKDIIKIWNQNYRFPLVTVTRNYNQKSAVLTQSLYLRNRPHDVKGKDLIWTIPIVLKTQDKLDFTDTKPAYWMKKKELSIQNVAGGDRFIIVNPEEIGPFMVNYDKTNWNMLADFLQSTDRLKIPVVTRAKLIHDALNLAYAGSLDFGTALNMTLYLKDETEYIAWRPFFIMFDHIGRHIDGSPAHKKFTTYVSGVVKQLYNRLKANEKEGSDSSRDFIDEVKAILRNAGDENILKQANTVYNKWMKDPTKGYQDLSKYLCPIYEFGSKEQWEFGLNTLLNLPKDTDIERSYLFKCLVGCPSERWRMKKFLNMTIFEQNNVFTDEDISYALSMLTGGAAGYMATFEYLKDNWSTLKNQLKNKPEIWKDLIYTATNLHKSQDGLNQVTELYSKHRGEFGAAEATIQNSIKKIKEEVKWSNDNLDTLEDWLDNYLLKNNAQN